MKNNEPLSMRSHPTTRWSCRSESGRHGPLLVLLVALALLRTSPSHADELDAMPPEVFSHYAKTRLTTLAGTAHSVQKIARIFDEKCRNTPDPKQREADCAVARSARLHLHELMTEEVELIRHLRRAGQANHAWVSAEDREFWSQVDRTPSAPR